ncbi:MAG: DNA polymerase III subunit beta [Verrucomicrobia bacterium]|nr:DNA polymerase III subunit beta [Verrucomicrobiota bacterium]MDA1005895.1 DNA polymerase III subunit beta [Verrucomicrobiota bacterium]
MIKIPTDSFKQAGKLLRRLPFHRAKLPVFTHVALFADAASQTVTLVVATLDMRLETSIPPAEPLSQTVSFLIPPEALRSALKADRGSVLVLAYKCNRKGRSIRLKAPCGGIPIETQHDTLDLADFPMRPRATGTATVLPGRTFEMLSLVATCASSDQTRQILNGVYFTPEDGGLLIATDGRRLAGAPATVPTAGSFILPKGAVHILGHPDFRKNPTTVTLTANKDDNEGPLVCFQSENHLLFSRTLSGTYPNWKQVMPRDMVTSLTIAEERRPALLTWLRSLRGAEGSVTLSRKRRGVLQLIHADRGNITSTVEVPVEQSGELEPISLDPAFLATALGIAPTLWFSDSMSPVIARRLDGAFCVIMPMRFSGLPTQRAGTKAGSSSQAAA